MTLELLIQLLPLVINAGESITKIIEQLHASGADPKAPLAPEHQAAVDAALASIANPLGDPDGPE